MYRSRIDIRVRADEKADWIGWAKEFGMGHSAFIRLAVPYYYAEQRKLQTQSAPDGSAVDQEPGVPVDEGSANGGVLGKPAATT